MFLLASVSGGIPLLIYFEGLRLQRRLFRDATNSRRRLHHLGVLPRETLRNAYQVLLTRARQGMVIFVPHGDASDPTRSPAYYDSTFQYLANLGVRVL